MVVAGLSTADSSSALLRPLVLRGDQSLPPPQLSTGYNRVRLREPVRPERGEGSCSPAVMRIGALLAQRHSDGIKKNKTKKTSRPYFTAYRARVCLCLCVCLCVRTSEKCSCSEHYRPRFLPPPPSCLTFGANLELGR